jgi:hypothetical protein
LGEAGGDGVAGLTHDPEKHVLDLIGDGSRFSEKIMRKKTRDQAVDPYTRSQKLTCIGRGQVDREGAALLSDSDQRHKKQKIDCGWSWKCNWSAISLHLVKNNTLRAARRCGEVQRNPGRRRQRVTSGGE